MIYKFTSVYLLPMYEFLEGEIVTLKPTYVVVNCNGIGYMLHISLYTYEELRGLKQARIITYLSVKEDSLTFYGFAKESERHLFTMLLSVNGVGTNTARMMLSSLPASDLIQAILNGNVALLRSIKGIGPKSAQRIVLELQDKLGKKKTSNGITLQSNSSEFDEALAALISLGFSRSISEKTLLKVSKAGDFEKTVEEYIKESLKIL